MAQTPLQDVKDNLPPEASTQGWNDAKIQILLDAQVSLNRIMVTYWSSRAAATVNLVSVSESGSTRSLSDIHKQAVDMLKYWTDLLEKEETVTPEEASIRPIAFQRLRRV
jgi:hypothetical protein